MIVVVLLVGFSVGYIGVIVYLVELCFCVCSVLLELLYTLCFVAVLKWLRIAFS